MNNWIDVEKELPAFDTEVLVFDDGEVHIAYYTKLDNDAPKKGQPDVYHIWEDARRFDDGEVPLMIYPTHWMPLPAPPQKDGITFDPNPVDMDS